MPMHMTVVLGLHGSFNHAHYYTNDAVHMPTQFCDHFTQLQIYREEYLR